MLSLCSRICFDSQHNSRKLNILIQFSYTRYNISKITRCDITPFVAKYRAVNPIATPWFELECRSRSESFPRSSMKQHTILRIHDTDRASLQACANSADTGNPPERKPPYPPLAGCEARLRGLDVCGLEPYKTRGVRRDTSQHTLPPCQSI